MFIGSATYTPTKAEYTTLHSKSITVRVVSRGNNKINPESSISNSKNDLVKKPHKIVLRHTRTHTCVIQCIAQVVMQFSLLRLDSYDI